MQAIRTTGLAKRYGDVVAVNGLNLEIDQGELFALLGVNGAGKTTVVKMLSCLAKPAGGQAFVGGYSITKESEQVKRIIGVSPQETAIAPNLSVIENLQLICGIHGFSKEKTKERTDFTAAFSGNSAEKKGRQVVRRLATPCQHSHGPYQRSGHTVSGRAYFRAGCAGKAGFVAGDKGTERQNHHYTDHTLYGGSPGTG